MLFNIINNKVYIGQTVDFKSRMKNHKSCKRPDKIHRAIEKYGWNNFDKLILDQADNKEKLDTLECFYIEKFKSIEFGYNLKTGGANGLPSEETRLKQSICRIGIKNHMFGKKLSLNARLLISKNRPDISGNKNPMFNKPRPLGAGKQKQSIKCIETNIIFSSMKECAVNMNLDHSTISKYFKGKVKSIKGFHFELVK